MKKMFYGMFLFITMFLISNNVYAIESGSIRCKYMMDEDNIATLVFNVEDGKSELVNTIIRVAGEDSENFDYIYSGQVATEGACPQSITISNKTITSGGSYKRVETSSTTAPSWLSGSDKVSCGNIGPFSRVIPSTISLLINVVMILAPVLLVIMGTVDFFKSTMSAKDDNVKKNQKAFIDRLIAAILVFLMIALVKLFVSLITKSMGTNAGIIECIDCFINNKCS